MATKDPFKGDDSPKSIVTAAGFDVSRLPVEELLALRQQIDAALPARSLKDINIEEELVLQMMALQFLQQRALDDEDIPANQVAQTCNALSSSLKNLAEVQNSIYDSERLKKSEAILITLLRKLPNDLQAAFFEDYEKMIGEMK